MTLYNREPVIQMSEDIKYADRLLIDAKSYTDWTHSILPQLNSMTTITFSPDAMKTHGVKLGDKYFYCRAFPKTHKVWRYQSMFSFMPSQLIKDNEMVERPCGLHIYGSGIKKRGKAFFTDEIGIPVLANHKGDPWMSLTPMEIMSQRVGVKRARGNVLVGGCGMGWFARRCLERSKVKHLTICDIDNDVLQYFGGQIKKEYGDRVTLIHSDIYKLDPMDYDSYLSDIWEGMNDMPYDRKFKEIKEYHPNAWGWGYV
jgi:hypothetical protein